MRTNGNIANTSIRKSTIVTPMDQNALNYEEVEAFTDMAYEANGFLKGIRHENRKSSKGTIDKVGVRGRNMRSKKENIMASNTPGLTFPQIPYSVEPVIVPFDITEEFIRQTQRVRGQNAEDIIMRAMANNYGENMQDIGFNGDTATSNTDPDYEFLCINDGWLKKARTTGHYLDWKTLSAKEKTGILFEVERAIPTRYRAGGVFKYFMHPNTFSERLQMLAEKDTSASIQLQILGARRKSTPTRSKRFGVCRKDRFSSHISRTLRWSILMTCRFGRRLRARRQSGLISVSMRFIPTLMPSSKSRKLWPTWKGWNSNAIRDLQRQERLTSAV